MIAQARAFEPPAERMEANDRVRRQMHGEATIHERQCAPGHRHSWLMRSAIPLG
jgi:hypothetical protein